MNIGKFSFSELFSNSQGKTSLSLVCALILVVTGSAMGIKGTITLHGESMLHGLGFAGLGTGLLGIRRFSKDKAIPDDVKEEFNQTKNGV